MADSHVVEQFMAKNNSNERNTGDNNIELVNPSEPETDTDQSRKTSSRFKVEFIDEKPAELAPRSPTPPSSPSKSFDHNSFSYHDTHNLKTFGHNTLEALPHADHYRNLLSTQVAIKSRPTLEELHEEKDGDITRSRSNEDDLEKSLIQSPTEDKPDKKPPTQQGAIKFGWIKGVLIRCLLNIWGVMLFLRLSWVVGQAGIGYASIIIILSAVVTIITTLSMSAICTNGEVKGGGAYYMISRSLGPEFGGAIGLIFSMANAVAVAMYVVGFAETVRDLIKDYGTLMTDADNDVRIIGLITVCVLLVIAIIGMEWEARAQVVLLVILIVAIINFIVGSFIPPTDEEKSKGFVGYSGTLFSTNFGPSYSPGESFFSVFSVFFPAATGILAGANISGDLEDAQGAIPKGTLLAILISTLTYLGMAWMVGGCVLRHATGVLADAAYNNMTQCMGDECRYGLLNTNQNMELVSGFWPLITTGIFAATISSALASLVSAPKVFQAVCKDEIFPKIILFAKGYGKSQEPRRAYLLTFIIAIGFIAIGKLNAIAPIISNFFLMSYTLINYSCFDASLAKSPGFRPAFKFYNQWVSLFGALLCLSIMFIIQWWAALITFVVIAALYAYVHYAKPDVNWGSSTQAHFYKNALNATLKLVFVQEHVKNFRPQVIVLTGDPRNRPSLVDFVSNMTKNISLMICGHVVLGDRYKQIQQMRQIKPSAVYSWLNKRKVPAFYKYTTASSYRTGVQNLLESSGLGKLKPNTVIIGFKTDWQEADPADVEEYFNVIHDSFDLHFGVGVLRTAESFYQASPIQDLKTSESVPAIQPVESMALIHHDETVTDMKPALQPSENKTTATGDSGQPQNHSGIVVKFKSGSTERVDMDDADDNEDKQSDDEDEALEEGKMVIEHTQFQQKQKGGTIDVWWLFDDGGLTLLIPYILSTKSRWSKCELRVFMAGTKKQELDRDKKNMATLLSKFRIDYSKMTVIPTVGKTPTEESKSNFKKLISPWLLNEDEDVSDDSQPWKISQAELMANKDKTNRQLRIRELLNEYSKDKAKLIVLTLPMPRKGSCSSGLYMAWLDTLTKDLPPILLLRGNQSSVLTYYS